MVSVVHVHLFQAHGFHQQLIFRDRQTVYFCETLKIQISKAIQSDFPVQAFKGGYFLAFWFAIASRRLLTVFLVALAFFKKSNTS